MKLFKFLLGCVIFFVAFSIVAAAYEQFNGGPWYTMVNASKDRVIMGQTVRTTYQVYDEQGKLLETMPGWKFPDEAPNALIRDGKGKIVYKEPVKLPQWIEITDAILQPFLKVGHFIVDNAILLFQRIT